jgi:Rad3-related DNA helicase
MGHRAQVITPAEVVHVTDIGLPDGTVFFFDERPLTALVSAALGGAALDDEKARMLIVERATLDVASGLLDELLGSRAIDGARTAALLLRAAKAAEDEEYGLALIIAWSLSEQMLNAHWVKYIERQGASKARIKKLQERDWTAGVVTETLSIAKELSDELYTELNAVRRARNRWAHELRPIAEDEAHRAVKLAGSMLTSVGGFSLALRPWRRGSTTP